jgi:hypothetical protein
MLCDFYGQLIVYKACVRVDKFHNICLSPAHYICYLASNNQNLNQFTWYDFYHFLLCTLSVNIGLYVTLH